MLPLGAPGSHICLDLNATTFLLSDQLYLASSFSLSQCDSFDVEFSPEAHVLEHLVGGTAHETFRR